MHPLIIVIVVIVCAYASLLFFMGVCMLMDAITIIKRRDPMRKEVVEETEEMLMGWMQKKERQWQSEEISTFPNEPVGLRYWLTPKKRDPMKKVIAKVQREIEAKKWLLERTRVREAEFSEAANNAHTEGRELRKEIVRMEECLETLKTLQEKK